MPVSERARATRVVREYLNDFDQESGAAPVGGGDSAALLNKVSINELKNLIKKQVGKQLHASINRNLLTLGFTEDDSYILWNYFTSNFFVSTGGGASLEFLEFFLKDKGKSELATYLPGTTALMDLTPS